jgi:hypothetical protein
MSRMSRLITVANTGRRMKRSVKCMLEIPVRAPMTVDIYPPAAARPLN